MERAVTAQEKEEEVEVEEEQKEPVEPTFPPQAEDSSKEETSVPPEGSLQKEESGESRKDSRDDTAPKQEPAKRFYYGCDITGNEGDSVFRKLADCFTNNYQGEWAGFYNQGYPVSPQHRHMFWHVKYRATTDQHQNHWHSNTDVGLMLEYIARHKDQLPLEELDAFKNTCEYGCSDPRLHPLHREHSEKAAMEAERRINDDFNTLTKVLESYIQEHKVLPYCFVLNCLASRYLGGGSIDPTHMDEEHPYRSSPQFSLMFWNLGNGCRKRFEQCPLPERLQRFAPNIDYNIDHEHKPIGDDKPQ